VAAGPTFPIVSLAFQLLLYNSSVMTWFRFLHSHLRINRPLMGVELGVHNCKYHTTESCFALYTHVSALFLRLWMKSKGNCREIPIPHLEFTWHRQDEMGEELPHWMFTERSLNAPWMFTKCSLKVHWIFTDCSLTVHWMFTEYSLNVHWMFPDCSLNVSLNVHWMFTECSLNVPWMFPECSLNAH
jgi:hypothetical protein